MSVVNQMLRDLEKRRGGERHGSGTVLQGIVTTGEPRRGRPWLFAAVALLVAGLGGLAGYLLWERRANQEASAAQVAKGAGSLPAVVVAPPAEPSLPAAVPVTPGFVALEPVEDRKVQPVVVGAEETPAPSPASRPREARVVGAVAPVAPAAPVATVAPVTSTPVAAAPTASVPSVVEKKALPPTAQALAAVAYQKGYEALRAGHREEAEHHLRESLRHDPAHVPARESLAGLLLTAGRRVEAGEVLDTGLKVRPEALGLRKLNARLHVEQGDVDGAVATLEAGADAAARDADYHALLAALYQRQGAFDKSVQRYEQALMLNGDQGVWWLGLAISTERAGHKSDALTAYKRALTTGLTEKLAAYANERIKILDPAK